MVEDDKLVSSSQTGGQAFPTTKKTTTENQLTLDSLMLPPEEAPEAPPTLLEKGMRLLPLLILSVLALMWAVLDEIPIEVEGRAVLVVPRADREIQSRAAGQILAVHVQPEDTVKEGQLVATLERPELQAELSTHQQKLAQLEGENRAIEQAEIQHTQLKSEALQRERDAVLQDLQSLKTQQAANQQQIVARKIQREANARQRQAYQQRIQQLQGIDQLIQARQDAYEKLSSEGVIAHLSPDLLRAIQAEQNNKNTSTTLLAQLEDLWASDQNQQAAIQQLASNNQDLTAQIQNHYATLADLKAQRQQLDLENLEADVTRIDAISDVARAIANLKVKIETESRILSPDEGTLLDLSVNPGQYVEAGTRLATVRAALTAPTTVGLSFFQVKDADRITPGMTLEIIPDIHRRERYGGIVATVSRVAQTTAIPQEVASLVGNQELAAELTDEQALIQVTAQLQRDSSTTSGYQWTRGQGPQQKIPDGATAIARIEVERRSLVSYLTPILRQLTGIYSR